MKLRTIIAQALLLTSTSYLAHAEYEGNSAYIPPYTDEDRYDDEDEVGIDGHDDADATDEHVHPEDGQTRPDKCYGLALSDSHNVGPFQAGVIKGLIENMKAGYGAEYQTISGIAVGALNAHILA